MAFFGKKREKRALDHRIGAYFLGLGGADANIQKLSTVLAAVNVLCQDLARVPLDLYERRDDGGRVKATGHPVQDLLKRPNPMHSGYRFFYQLWSAAIWYGNGYAVIRRSGGVAAELWVVDPTRVAVSVNGDTLLYTVSSSQSGGGSRTYQARDIIHVPGYGYDGRIGYPLADYLLHVANLQERVTKFLTGYFQSGASPGMVVKLPFDPTQEEAEQIKAKFQQFKGSHNWFNVAVLPRDWDLTRLSMELDEQKLLALLTFTVEEVARLLRLPLWKLGIYQNLNYNSLELMSSIYIADSISPWMTSLVEELEAKLLTPGRHYIEPNYNALLQTNTEARYRAYATGLQWGFMTHNEVRQRENLPSYGDFGDKVMIPANMLIYRPGEDASAQPAPSGEEAPRSKRAVQTRGLFLRRSRHDVVEAARIKQRVALSYRKQFEAELGRILRRETNDVIQKMAKLGVSNELYDWYLNDYQPRHRDYVVSGLRDVMIAEAEAVQALVAAEVQGFAGITPRVQDCIDVHAERVADRLLKRNASALHGIVLDGLEEAEARKAVQGWIAEVAPQLAAWEAVRISGLVSKAEYHYHGLPFQWVHLDNLSPCELLDGKVLQPSFRCEGNPFLSVSDQLRLKDGREFNPGWNVTTPPITEGCTCQIMAVFD
ncbi:MAG: phage portal protein [Actinomycetota bacterium]|jgi:HK97 family phage portal protein|nr:phage portal protein [Actinomycetota bacterium]